MSVLSNIYMKSNEKKIPDIFLNDVSADFKFNMASSDPGDDSLYPIAVLIDELRNEDVQVWFSHCIAFQMIV